MIESAESDAVTAFIRARQPEVLAEAIRQLSSCSREDLSAVAHAVSGNVGSYQLEAAHGEIEALRAVLADPGASKSDVEAARASTVEVLRAQESGFLHG